MAALLHSCSPAPTRRLLQTCPIGQTLSNGNCVCNPGTRDGTLVNPLMRCNGNNTLCPWTLWRGTTTRDGHITGANWPFQHFNLGVDGNPWSSFKATCSFAAPAEVTIDMQTPYRISSIRLWAGTMSYGAMTGMIPDYIDATSTLGHTTNMDIRMGNSVTSMVTCYSSGNLASFGTTFINTMINVTTCSNLTARYINISMRGTGSSPCGFRDLQILAIDPSTVSTCQGCPANKSCRQNITFDCPLATPVSSENALECTCLPNMFLNGSQCVALPGFMPPLNFTFDNSLVSPYPAITSVSSGKIQQSTGVNCFWGKCLECFWGSPPYGRIIYSTIRSFEITVGFLTRSSPTGMQADNIIKFFSPLTFASAATWQPSGGYAGIDLARGYGTATTTVNYRSLTPATLWPYLTTDIGSGPLSYTRYHWTFVLNRTTLTMYINAVLFQSISGITWGAEFPSLEMFGGSQFYDSLVILPVALSASQIYGFVQDSITGKDMGVFRCMANSYCMNGTLFNCPGNLVSPVGSNSISNCSCRQPDMSPYNSTHCVCSAFRTFNNVTFGVCSNCPGSVNYVSCSIGRFSNYTVSLECSDYFCTLCPAGTFNNITNVTICALCPAGKFSTGTGLSVCTNCATGTFIDLPGQTVCKFCTAGTFMSTTGFSVCTNCSIGTYMANVGYSACTRCEAGRYSTASAGTRCDLCVAGKFSTTQGSVNDTCQNCSIGFYMNLNGAGACTISPTGSFTASVGQTMFSPCLTGTFSSMQGLTACLQCRAGTFTSITSTVTCTACGGGTYTSTTGQALCTSCSSGKFSTLLSSASELNCTNCPAGTFGQFEQSTVCSNCSINYFGAQPGSSVCGQCSPDTYTTASRSTVCTQCAQGSQMTITPTVTMLFVGDKTNYVIRAVSPENGTVTTVAGSGVMSTIDGNGRAATFRSIEAITLSYDQKLLYVGDAFCVRSMTTNDNNYTVRTILGLCGSAAETYGAVSVARLYTINAICADPDGGGLYIADSQHKIKYFDFTTQTLRFFAGDGNGGAALNGIGAQTRIYAPKGIYISKNKTFMLIGYLTGVYHFNLTTRYGQFIVGSSWQQGATTGIGTAVLMNTAGDLLMNADETMIYAIDQSNTRIRTITYPQLNTQFLSATTATSFNLVMTPDGVRLLYTDATTIKSLNLTSPATAAVTLSGSATAGFIDGLRTVAQFRSLYAMRLAQLRSTSCVQCTAGSFRNASVSQCTNCTPGSFSAVAGSSNCTACPPGTYASATRSTACAVAPIGSFTVGAASIFTPCPPGTFAPSPGSSTCTGCPPGNYLPDIQSTACAVCTAGDFSLGNVAVCSFCAAGTFSSSDAATGCTNCPGGSYSPAQRATACLGCTAGTFSNGTASVCLACSPGGYASAESATECLGCQGGQYSAHQATECLACTAGTYSAATASACLLCDPGYHAPAGSATACQPCQAGAHSPAQQATECLLCPPGQHASAPAASACPLCDEGSFASGYGTVNCSKCSVCIAANTGLQQTCPQGATVNNVTCGCANNFYGVMGDCHPCPQNTQTVGQGAESLLDCRCLEGYVCQYSKRINVRLTLSNITWDMLDANGIANSPIIDAIAAAAGVPRGSVVIDGIVARNPGRRRMRETAADTEQAPPDADGISIWATVWGASGLNGALASTLLNPYRVDSLSWTHGHSVRVAREWGSLI